MIERKRPAPAVLVGFQGRRLDCHSWQSGTSGMNEVCEFAMRNHVPSLEDVMRSAGARESALAEVGSCDRDIALSLAESSFKVSRMRLELAGFLERRRA